MGSSVVIIKCGTCGKVFSDFKSNRRKYCGRGCVPQGSWSRTHGQSKSRLHRIWCNMKSRCKGGSTLSNKYYASKHITVCDEWRQSFTAFQSWAISHGYDPKLEIDRIDPNGDYCPSNCRWATRLQQMANASTRTVGKTSQYRGVGRIKPTGKWRAMITRNGRPKHIGVFVNEEDAAKAYDTAARDLYGEFARTNF